MGSGATQVATDDPPREDQGVVPADEDLPVLPVVEEPRSRTVRGLLAALQQRHAAIEAESPARVRYRRRTAWERWWRDLRRRGPGWAASLGVHALVLLVTAQIVWFIRNPDAVRSILVSLSREEAPVAGESPQPEADGADEAPEPAAPEAEEAPDPEPAAPEPDAVEAAPDPAPIPELPVPDAQTDAAPPAGAGDAATGGVPGTVAPEAATDSPTLFSNRTGSGRTEALRKYGGSTETEAAVEMGLRWLAAHQHPDGRWSSANFWRLCPGAEGRWAGRSVSGDGRDTSACTGSGRGGNDVAQTGLALLCFLGAGHLPKSRPYGDQVRKALDYLMQQQRPNGGWLSPRDHGCMYNHGAAALALCEAAALTGDDAVKGAAQRAVDYLVAAQRSTGGWDYTGVGVKTTRSDLSVSGWAIMALKSAVAADLRLARRPWDRARSFVQRSQRRDGSYTYATGNQRSGPGMTAAGLACDLYLGTPPATLRLQHAAGLLAAEPPDPERVRSNHYHSYYYWYYGTLALFQVGGERWHAWNAAMRTALLEQQCKDGHAAGSWNPDSPWLGRAGGRVCVTALNVLTLEVYYRYLPVYRDTERADGDDGGPPRTAGGPGRYDIADVADAIVKVKAESPAMRAAAVERLAESGQDAAFDAIARAMRDKRQMVRYAAVQALTKRPEPDATRILLRALATESRDMRKVIARALGRRGDLAAVPALIGLLEGTDAGLQAAAERSLTRLTTLSHGRNAGAWRRWWNSRRK